MAEALIHLPEVLKGEARVDVRRNKVANQCRTRTFILLQCRRRVRERCTKSSTKWASIMSAIPLATSSEETHPGGTHGLTDLSPGAVKDQKVVARLLRASLSLEQKQTLEQGLQTDRRSFKCRLRVPAR